MRANIGDRERSQWGTGRGGASYRVPADKSSTGIFVYPEVPVTYERRGEKSGLLISSHIGPLRFVGTLGEAIEARKAAIEANKRASANASEVGALAIELVAPKEEWDPTNEVRNCSAGVTGMGLTDAEKHAVPVAERPVLSLVPADTMAAETMPHESVQAPAARSLAYAG